MFNARFINSISRVARGIRLEWVTILHFHPARLLLDRSLCDDRDLKDKCAREKGLKTPVARFIIFPWPRAHSVCMRILEASRGSFFFVANAARCTVYLVTRAGQVRASYVTENVMNVKGSPFSATSFCLSDHCRRLFGLLYRAIMSAIEFFIRRFNRFPLFCPSTSRKFFHLKFLNFFKCSRSICHFD